jgi:hypothetical protein
MAMEQRSASLLSMVASKALVRGSFASEATTPAVAGRERSDADFEEQRAQTMMYSARMTYLQDNDGIKPDALFLTRKQAQKLVKQDSVATLSLRKLEVVGNGKGSNSGSGASGVGGGGGDGKGIANPTTSSLSPNGKKQRGLLQLDDRQQTWAPITQAGCHFWQSQETGECRAVAPGEWQGQPHPDDRQFDHDDEDEGDGEDPPFPASFAFLNPKE